MIVDSLQNRICNIYCNICVWVGNLVPFAYFCFNLQIWSNNGFILHRPHEYSPVYQSGDSITHILFSSGTTGNQILLYDCWVDISTSLTLPYLIFYVICNLWIRGSKGSTLDSVVSNSSYCWFMGTHGCSSWRCHVLADKLRMGGRTYIALRMLFKWCNSCSLSWITSWPWFWEICSGDASRFSNCN